MRVDELLTLVVRVRRDNVDDAHVSDESPVMWPNTAHALATSRKFISVHRFLR